MQAHVAKQSYTASNNSQSSRLIKALTQRFSQLGAMLVRFLAPQDTLHIQTREQNGHITWIVSDRTTRERQQFTSEPALRTWLEESYYQ
ncbi:MAG: hypothetical protein AAFX01_13940 [Cyanobacteria bacterium J06638_28]